MGSLIIENANLFIGVDEEVIANGAVWVSDGVIKFSGAVSDLPAGGENIERYDALGKFVMPGMTESHVHLSYNLSLIHI